MIAFKRILIIGGVAILSFFPNSHVSAYDEDRNVECRMKVYYSRKTTWYQSNTWYNDPEHGNHIMAIDPEILSTEDKIKECYLASLQLVTPIEGWTDPGNISAQLKGAGVQKDSTTSTHTATLVIKYQIKDYVQYENTLTSGESAEFRVNNRKHIISPYYVNWTLVGLLDNNEISSGQVNEYSPADEIMSDDQRVYSRDGIQFKRCEFDYVATRSRTRGQTLRLGIFTDTEEICNEYLELHKGFKKSWS